MSMLKELIESNPNRQIKKLARNWYLSEMEPKDRKKARLEFEEDRDVRKYVIEQYFEEHEGHKERYEARKKLWFRINVAGLAVAATLGAGVYTCVKQQTNKNPIEQETEFDDNFAYEYEKQEAKKENEYDQFFKEAREIENADKREDYITNYTKQIIVDKYNEEHPDNPITVDELETLILEETVLKKTDRLGNHTYERVSQNSEGKDLVKIGYIYDFRIDGKTVAVFDSNGDMLNDKNVEKQDMSFQKAIKVVIESEKLKDIYKYPSNDNEKEEAEKKYAKIIEEYEAQTKDIHIAKSSQEREYLK